MLSVRPRIVYSVDYTADFDEQCAVLSYSKVEWVEFAFEDRMYGDDMECG